MRVERRTVLKNCIIDSVLLVLKRGRMLGVKLTVDSALDEDFLYSLGLAVKGSPKLEQLCPDAQLVFPLYNLSRL